MFALSWPAVASLVAGAISLSFLYFLWPRRDVPGGRAFLVTIGFVAVWSLSYGAALTVFDPMLRLALEVPIWLSVNFVGVAFLAFALTYTGRGNRVDSWWMGALILWATFNSVAVITNDYHHLVWTNYHLDPVFGAATVQYTRQPWLFVNVTSVALTVALAAFLLLETVLAYGPLYRKQAVALALSPVPPGVAYILYLFGLGPAPALNLTPLVFPLHLGLDMYALFSQGMFDLTPATRRVGERAAVDDLGSAVVIVDTEERVVTMNPEAERVLGVETRDALARPLDAFLPAAVSFDGDGGTLTVDTDDGRRVFDVTTNPLNDPDGAHVGYTLLLYDVTGERRLKQRLEVLNRVLRHNLRNDLNVAAGNLDLAAERAEDDDVRRLVEMADGKVESVIDLGETSRRIERALATAGDATAVDARDAIAYAVDRVTDDAEHGGVTLDVPGDLALYGSPELVDGLFASLARNALEHGGPDVALTIAVVARDADTATIEVRDDGPGIPDHELVPITRGNETDLEHGSGLGLWFVRWAVDALGGTIGFRTPPDGGTTVTLTLPTTAADPEPRPER
ncbi:sensor histidine kinase [Halocalculus aciditolerans]|uniref:sensor histidine kinase n=1 Tax=Halocalculus aciditolerans TaxID=1383812 RepID=UPI0016653135|nr:histidine kinase N-terminal 7TM domain-containing protein [Halocalculus aciditolerans]